MTPQYSHLYAQHHPAASYAFCKWLGLVREKSGDWMKSQERVREMYISWKIVVLQAVIFRSCWYSCGIQRVLESVIIIIIFIFREQHNIIIDQVNTLGRLPEKHVTH